MYTYSVFKFMLLVSMEITNANKLTNNKVYIRTDDVTLVAVPSYIPSAVEAIYLTNDALSTVETDSLIGLHNLQALALSNNIIHTFPDLKHVKTSLQKLFLDGNLISFIPGNLLNQLENIAVLNVAFNLLSHFPDTTRPIQSLTSLNISGNNFNDIPVLVDLRTSLKELTVYHVPVTCNQELSWILDIEWRLGSCSAPSHLNGTSLMALNRDKLGLHDVELFSRSNKGLTYVPSGIPVNTTNIDFSKNTISQIMHTDFQNVTGLLVLQLRKNLITAFPNLTLVSKSLNRLDLSYNLISEISDELLDVLVNLKTLNLKSNHLSTFPNVLGPGNVLQFLDLSQNNFVTFPDLSKISGSLKYLYLTGNSLTNIPPENFIFKSKTASDLLIHLGSNNLTSVPLIAGLDIEQLMLLLYDNPLVCDDDIAELVAMNNAYIDGRCDQPVQMVGRYINDMTVQQVLVNGMAAVTPQKSVPCKIFNVSDPRPVERACTRANQLLTSVPDEPTDTAGSSRHVYARLLSSDIYSTTLPLEGYNTDTVGECITVCLSVSGCMYVNYKHTGSITMDYNCYIGSPYNTGQLYKGTIDGERWKYYIIE